MALKSLTSLKHSEVVSQSPRNLEIKQSNYICLSLIVWPVGEYHDSPFLLPSALCLCDHLGFQTCVLCFLL